MDKAYQSGNSLTLLILHWFDCIDTKAVNQVICLSQEIGIESAARKASGIPSVLD